MVTGKKNGFNRILALIQEDLFVSGLNFVFGVADRSAGAAIVSLARLKAHPTEGPEGELFLKRALKEAIHELGHTYGLVHCSNTRCIMHFSNTLKDTDVKGPGFCRSCTGLLPFRVPEDNGLSGREERIWQE